MEPAAFGFLGALNWLAIGLSLVAMLVLGALWYSPVTPMGKAWMRNLGLDPSSAESPDGAALGTSILLMAIGSFFLIVIFASLLFAVEDAFRNTATGGDASYTLDVVASIALAIFVWIGFIVPMNLNAVGFENKPWRIFWVDTGFYLTGLLIAAVLLATL